MIWYDTIRYDTIYCSHGLQSIFSMHDSFCMAHIHSRVWSFLLRFGHGRATPTHVVLQLKGAPYSPQVLLISLRIIPAQNFWCCCLSIITEHVRRSTIYEIKRTNECDTKIVQYLRDNQYIDTIPKENISHQATLSRRTNPSSPPVKMTVGNRRKD